MVYIAALVPSASSRASLTAPLALSLAENAFKAGRLESAIRYLDMAYAIFDAQAGTPAVCPNALPKGG